MNHFIRQNAYVKAPVLLREGPPVIDIPADQDQVRSTVLVNASYSASRHPGPGEMAELETANDGINSTNPSVSYCTPWHAAEVAAA